MSICLGAVSLLIVWILYKMLNGCFIKEVRKWQIHSMSSIDEESLEVLVEFKVRTPRNPLVFPDSARFKGQPIFFSPSLIVKHTSMTEI
jgi:hypothetical protein